MSDKRNNQVDVNSGFSGINDGNAILRSETVPRKIDDRFALLDIVNDNISNEDYDNYYVYVYNANEKEAEKAFLRVRLSDLLNGGEPAETYKLYYGAVLADAEGHMPPVELSDLTEIGKTEAKLKSDGLTASIKYAEEPFFYVICIPKICPVELDKDYMGDYYVTDNGTGFALTLTKSDLSTNPEYDIFYPTSAANQDLNLTYTFTDK